VRNAFAVISALALAGILFEAAPCAAQTGFEWHRGWYTDGTSDWYVVRDEERVLMSTATRRADLTVAGLVLELDLTDSERARSRPYGTDGPWTGFHLTYDGSDTFLIDGTPFTRMPDSEPVEDVDVEKDTAANRYGLFFLANQLDQNGESLPGP
jgi:hypothetical protein